MAAIVVWRRRQPSDETEMKQSGIDEAPETESDETIRIPVDPDDELEKDAAIVHALRSRGKMGDV